MHEVNKNKDAALAKQTSELNRRTLPTSSGLDSIPTSSSSSEAQDSSKTSKNYPFIQYPLTSFASTPHNVAAISFLLGVLWCVGMLLASSLLWRHYFLWLPPKNLPDSSLETRLEPQSLRNAISSPVLGIYLSSWATFHLLEFQVTSIWNPGKLSVSSFLLDNGRLYHIVHLLSILEHILENAFLPSKLYLCKHIGLLASIGCILIVGGQILRSFAMINASSNFSHIIAHSLMPSHQLVKTGIYAWSRHPSYAGFVWWALGTQVLLANPIGFVAFSVVLYQFFSSRIKLEERLLVQFFGDEYLQYRKSVPTRILFIR